MERNPGQLFLAGFDGLAVDADHPVVEAVVEHGLGGVILFDRNVDGSRQNIASPDQLRELTATLQRFGDNALLIAVDQEGGNVCRLRERDGFPATSPADRLAREDSTVPAASQARIVATSLRDCGINFNLAPVVDLDCNPDNPIIGGYGRSFGADPERVARFAREFIEAHHALGVACCLKHFPGHGSAGADSHLGFVDVSDRWREIELEPYRSLFAAGFTDAVMTAHVVHRGLDETGLPATLSRRMITGLLREELGFTGVVVSDDLQMRAITDRWSFEEAVRMAVLAGVDLLIVGNNLVRDPGAVQRGVRVVTEMVERGELAESDLHASLARVAELKRKIAGEVPWRNSQPTT
ncbi:MAG: glycoside hydrolase family 3 protein [Desulfobulbaceae bacterium]